ncbi:putative BET1-like protein [Hypsibius exemplaris]|uniref:BET1-like protein n=1 Tax=Hypsibius exemplaris TaxID=2072580 RepID=A0A1W0WR37_HYPEX|nr:putative BET1-like protein [Hypsibius exemplaris]
MHRSVKQGSTNSFGDGNSAARNRTMLEEENERMKNHLGQKISQLKSLTIDIGNEVRSQNRLIGEMDTDFDTSSGFLGGAMARLQKIQRAGYGSVTWKLLGFALVVCVLLYFIIRFK